MPVFPFGVGQLFLVPPGSNPTPINVGTLKDVSLDISRDVKEMYGANAFPEDVALGKGKITGKAKSGRFQASLIAAIMNGSTTTTGQTAAANNELNTIPATPYQCTAINGATFVQDGGVYDYTTGAWKTCVASLPAAGQYTVSAAGVYLFAAAETGHSIGLYYTYTLTTGVKVALSNQLMGSVTTFQVNVFNTVKGNNLGYTLYACVFPKLSFGNKQDDYSEVDIEFQAFTDSNGRVLSIYNAQ